MRETEVGDSAFRREPVHLLFPPCSVLALTRKLGNCGAQKDYQPAAKQTHFS